MVNTTTYRKDFTDEERIAYNKYMVSRMQVFRKTEHGREVVNANNRKAYYKRKERLGIESRPRGRPPKQQVNIDELRVNELKISD